MKHRTAKDERRSGIRLLVVAAVLLAALLALWWLVERTNTEGEHDAQLLPFFALIPLLLGLYHLFRSRSRAVK
jgi:apolipoprotein N-acyltransferase